MNQNGSASLWGAPGPALPVSVYLHTKTRPCGCVGAGARTLTCTTKQERERQGERSGGERRLRENTRRTHWLNMIRGTHMALLRQNQMPFRSPDET